jgi:HK97 family phage portal protein
VFKKIRKLFQKETKSIQNLTVGELSQYLFGYNQYTSKIENLISSKALKYYKNCSPVYKSINLIANLLSSLPFKLIDKKNGEEKEDHELIKLLNRPSYSTTSKEFKFEYAVNMQIFGNNYNYIIGGSLDKRPPVEIQNITPIFVTENLNKDNEISSYILKINNIKQVEFKGTFLRVGNKMIVIYVDDKENLLYQSKLFNPNNSIRGLSPLTSLLLTMDSFNEASNHNLSVLKNGGRPSGLLTLKGGYMDKETHNELKDAFKREYEGTNNAGKTIIVEGDIDYKNISMTQKDMDWLDGKKMSKNDIYESLGIPLALVDNKASTFNNLSTAMYSLYEHTVFPLMDKIVGELSDSLLWRYKDGEDLILTYDKSNIPSLEVVESENILNKAKTGIYTVNELRKIEGLEEVEGGDVLFNNYANNIPISEDGNTEEIGKQSDEEKFIDLMRENKYNDNEIETYVKSFKERGLLK